MADNFADFYSGSMAPPLKLPGGGYAPAPSSQSQMSPEEFYQGIYGEPLQLTSRSVQSAPINPSTGMPYATTANASMQGGGGIAAGGRGEVRYSPPVYQPNGTVVENKSQSRLPAMPAGMPLAGAFASGKSGLGASGFGSGSLTASIPAKAPSNGVLDLSFEPMSEVSGQNMANSSGRPVRGPSGKTYYPSNTPQSGVRAPYDQAGAAKYSGKIGQDSRGPLSQMLGLKTSGLGGLLGGLFGGMQQRQALGQVLGMVPGVGSAVSAPSLGYNAAYAQSAGGDGQGNNGISESGGRYGGARSLTS